MKTHTTNYYNTFIEVAPDCPVARGEVPAMKGDQKTIAGMQFDLVYDNPYKFTSDDIFFEVFAQRNDLPRGEYKDARTKFFSKGQPCFRASPLTKRYGWGVHCDKAGKVGIYGCESPEYKALAGDASLKILKAMKSSR